jgi:hypothetical protein
MHVVELTLDLEKFPSYDRHIFPGTQSVNCHEERRSERGKKIGGTCNLTFHRYLMESLVYRYKTLLMQRLLDWTARGYYAWTNGTVSPDRAIALCEKFDTHYFVSRGVDQRKYRKAKGEANAVLLLADLDHKSDLHWWLLVTHGQHPAWALEQLRDSRDRHTRIEVPGGYEMIQQQNDRRNGGKVRWTWRMKDNTYEMWESNIRSAIRANRPEQEIGTLLANLGRAPGFHVVRSQIHKLKWFMRSEWKRAGLGNFEIPDRQHPYVRRLADEEYTVLHWFRDRGGHDDIALPMPTQPISRCP